ncbi:MAG TPA: very short patch repair endonuclease [Turneriella sp.]|nr:very short patch repair endonuclease [Turneriella sp.]
MHDKKTRSYNMSRIRGRDTKPELIVRKYLTAQGYRYRLNYAKLPGKPDIALLKFKTVIFVHGCFWHGHKGCKYFVLPKTRPQWWKSKIEGTQARDKRISRLLRQMGWQVIVIYECGLRPMKKELTLGNLVKKLRRA